MALAGGFGLRNTFILFGAFNILVILLAAIINNFFPAVPFASIITAYVNLFLTSITLFLAGTVGFAEIVINVAFQGIWALLSFLWVLIFEGEIPDILANVPSFNLSPLTNLFVSLFTGIIGQPLLFDGTTSTGLSLAVGGATTTALVTRPSVPLETQVIPLETQAVVFAADDMSREAKISRGELIFVPTIIID